MPSSGIYETSSYLTENTLRLHCRTHSVNAVKYLRFSRWWIWTIPSYGTLRCVALARTDLSKKPTRIGDLRILVLTGNRSRLRRSISPETSVITRITRRNFTEDAILSVWPVSVLTLSWHWNRLSKFQRQITYTSHKHFQYCYKSYIFHNIVSSSLGVHKN
jgi:hypothetical protein